MFKMSSYNHSSDMITLKLKDLIIPERIRYQTSNILDYDCEFEEFNANLTYPDWWNRTFSTAGFKLTLTRNYSKYIISYYLPSFLFVAISWISFLIPPEVVPGRLGMLITVLLVLVNLFGTVVQTKPPTKYPTALEIWLIMCVKFVFGAILAYAVLLFKSFSPQFNTKTYYNPSIKPASINPSISRDTNDKKVLHPTSLRKWDKYCLVLFPIGYLIFNLIYWPILISNRKSIHYV